MSKVLVTESNLQDIADAIRSKNEGTDTYRPGDMAAAILAIPTGSTSTLVSKTITQNGEYDPEDDNADGYSDVTVNVPNSYAAEDEGKVVSSGALVAQTGLSVTQNGTYDTTENNEVIVNVSGGTVNLQSKTVTENGTVTPDAGYDGLSSVVVNVQGGGGEDPFLLTDYIESNGTQFINTGYSVKDNSVFELIANASTTQPTYGTLFGTRSSNDDSPSSQSCILAVAWASTLGNINWGSGINRISNDDKGNKTRYVIKKELFVISLSNNVGDVLVAGNTGSTASATTQPLFLFTLGINGADYGSITHGNMKLYRFRIYEGNTLVHEYVPWTDDNSVVCLKDTVTSNLLYNAGTGNFVRGSDI